MNRFFLVIVLFPLVFLFVFDFASVSTGDNSTERCRDCTTSTRKHGAWRKAHTCARRPWSAQAPATSNWISQGMMMFNLVSIYIFIFCLCFSICVSLHLSIRFSWISLSFCPSMYFIYPLIVSSIISLLYLSSVPLFLSLWLNFSPLFLLAHLFHRTLLARQKLLLKSFTWRM